MADSARWNEWRTMMPTIQPQWRKLAILARIIVVLIVAAAIVTAGLYLNDIQQAKLRDLTVRMTDLKNEMRDLKAELPLRQNAVEQARARQAPVNARTSPAPQTQIELAQQGRLSSLIDGLMRAAEEDDVQIISIKPGEPQDHDSYVALPITMDVRARFRSLGEYLQEVQQLQQVVLVGRISMELSVVEQAGLTVRVAAVSFLGKA
jgi:Tfp pilus assembly protein PilO